MIIIFHNFISVHVYSQNPLGLCFKNLPHLHTVTVVRPLDVQGRLDTTLCVCVYLHPRVCMLVLFTSSPPNIIFLLNYLGILYMYSDHIFSHSSQAHPFILGSSLPKEKKKHKSNFYYLYTYWSMVKLPMASPLKVIESLPHKAITCEELRFSIFVTIFFLTGAFYFFYLFYL